jgi:hypothetical protein
MTVPFLIQLTIRRDWRMIAELLQWSWLDG